jgi:uncharacterized protein YbjQ (UPF0145 family)
MAGFDALGNGSSFDEFRDDLTAIRREALEWMATEAEGLGANAVAGLRFDTPEVGREMVEVVAYGTAVVLPDVWPWPSHAGLIPRYRQYLRLIATTSPV